jgi:hypothetical protein
MRDLAIQRQKKGSILKITSWALYYKNECTKLVDDITKLLDGLEKLFPAPAEQERLVRQDVEATAKEDAELTTLETVADGIDNPVQSTAKAMVKETRNSRVYRKMVTLEKGRVLNGDSYSEAVLDKDFSGIPPTSKLFEDVRTEGEARVQNGDRYGGKDFWD